MSGFRPTLSGIGHSAVGILAVLAFAGCAAFGDGEAPPYVAPDPDETCALATSSYRISSLDVPFTTSAGDQMGFNLDLDEQGRPDNAAGALYSTLAGQSDTGDDDLRLSLSRMGESDEVIWVLQVSTCADAADADGYAQVSVGRGSDVDGDGRMELAGTEVVPAVGYVVNGTLMVQRGQGEAPVSVLADVLGDRPIAWSPVSALAVELRVQDDGVAAGRIGFGVPAEHISLVDEPLAAFFTTWLQEDKSEFAAGADTNGDGVVSAAEFRATLLYTALFTPDVDLHADYEGRDVYWPRHDGVKDHLSFGAGFTATPVEVE